MKHFKSLIAVLVLSITALSCSSDDDSNGAGAEEENLVATWNMTAFEVDNGEIDLEVEDVEFEVDYTQVGSNFNYLISFAEDNSGTSEGGYDVTTTTTTTVFGQTETDTQTTTIDSDFSAVFDWTLDGDQLTVSDDTDAPPVTIQITTLTENTLVFEIDLADIENLGSEFEDLGGDATVEISGEAVYTFTRN